jgi:hypothetical protein
MVQAVPARFHLPGLPGRGAAPLAQRRSGSRDRFVGDFLASSPFGLWHIAILALVSSGRRQQCAERMPLQSAARGRSLPSGLDGCGDLSGKIRHRACCALAAHCLAPAMTNDRRAHRCRWVGRGSRDVFRSLGRTHGIPDAVVAVLWSSYT